LFIAINQSLLSIIFCLISITISIIGFKNSSEKVEIKDELKDQLQKELEEHKSEMKSIIKKYKQESLDKEISVITPCLIEELETKISKYNELSEKKSKILNEIKSKSEVLKEIEENKQEILQSLENAKKEEQEFLDKVSISNLKNYNEVATIIRGIRANTTKLNELKTNQSDIDTKSIDFVENINKFIETTEIDTLPKLCKDEFENFETSIKSIQKLIEENSTNKTLFDTLNSNKEKLKQELSEIKIEPDNFMSKEEYDFLNNSISEKQDRLAIVTHEIEQLKQVESLINIKNFKTAELNKLKNELYTLFINKMVYEIIQSSKEEFNKIQPNLVSAKNFLKTITNGKYTEINFDRKTISGENTPEKEWSELSRGTKEQLYLSLRLGYAQNYSKTNNGEENGRPNLPLIIDDAFVNFDKARTTAILECLKEFSNTNQVLFFTCHTEAIKGILDEKEIEYKQIEL
jgi:uncharacterized protein YhaN